MIEIHEPELEALIMNRFHGGSFETVEQALMDALQKAPLPERPNPGAASERTGSEIIAAFQRCPVRDFDFEPKPLYSPISDPLKF